MQTDFDEPSEHIRRINSYYRMSERGYELFLWGSKHFGYYPDNAKISERQAQENLQDLVAEKLELTTADHILDAGCGQGVVAIHLTKKYGCRVYGIDTLDFEIPKAQKRAKAQDVAARTSFEQMDYSATSFPNDHFDCVYTTETLSHSADLRKTIAELFRVLKPGGRAAFFEYSIAPDADLSPREQLMLERIIRGSAMVALPDFRHGAFDGIMQDAGFDFVCTEDISRNIMPSLARLRRYALLPYYLFTAPLGRQEQRPNDASAVEIHKMAKKGLVRYNIHTARKP